MPKNKPLVDEQPISPDEGGGEPPSGPRAPVLTAAIIVGTLLLIAGAWFAYHSFTKPLAVEVDRTQLAAIDAQRTRIHEAIVPIATELTSVVATGASGVIDIDAYRARIEKVRRIVDATSDLAATSDEALLIRDLVLTGGSQVVAGMEEAVDAIASDDASAVPAALSHVEEGLGNLEAARLKLDALLGRVETT
jgi:hypothetical protein